MKAVILAAGYGTRLYPLTIDKPKALLEVGGKTILERLLEFVFNIEGCDHACIVSNDRFYKPFTEWAQKNSKSDLLKGKKLEVLNDMTTSNDNRLGAIGDIKFVMEKKQLNDDLLVMGSDNLFKFSLADFVAYASKNRPHMSLAFYDIKDIKLAHLYGIASMDKNTGIVSDFQEKPKDPKSTLAATAIYYYPKEIKNRFYEYLSSGLSLDAPGNFVKWLISKEKVYGYVFTEKWYDIGDIESLKKADEEYREADNRNRKEGKR